MHSGIQTAPLHAKEYRLCEGNIIRVMQRISFNMRLSGTMFPIGKQDDDDAAWQLTFGTGKRLCRHHSGRFARLATLPHLAFVSTPLGESAARILRPANQ